MGAIGVSEIEGPNGAAPPIDAADVTALFDRYQNVYGQNEQTSDVHQENS